MNLAKGREQYTIRLRGHHRLSVWVPLGFVLSFVGTALGMIDVAAAARVALRWMVTNMVILSGRILGSSLPFSEKSEKLLVPRSIAKIPRSM